MTRPEWDAYFLNVAKAVATRADCTRRKVGAVIVKNHRIVSTGYNGVPSGEPGCLDGNCLRGKHYPVRKYPLAGFGATYCAELHGGTPVPDGMHGSGCMCKAEIMACACGKDLPCPDDVPPGSSYDTGPGTCIALHAEQNAIIYADYERCQGATLYCTHEPCDGCRKLIAGAGIIEVIYPDGGVVL